MIVRVEQVKEKKCGKTKLLDPTYPVALEGLITKEEFDKLIFQCNFIIEETDRVPGYIIPMAIFGAPFVLCWCWCRARPSCYVQVRLNSESKKEEWKSRGIKWKTVCADGSDNCRNFWIEIHIDDKPPQAQTMS
eukprot:TRINITY_DN2869_c0_g1_i1.p2 TRINITY_DN2869_c0_g1~~TRINITY_DN2869_c0_g1_i1.p2  ORF type:complete len:134 (-),score=28.98 TRINITY_DN2869_c0_g1_i1:208-609(-)